MLQEEAAQMNEVSMNLKFSTESFKVFFYLVRSQP